MGHSQSPILAVCQIADLGGVYLVSFWAALLNAFFAMFFLARLNIRPVAIAGAGVLVATAAVVGYGFFRLSQPVNGAGPKVLVVQPNYLQDNSGDKGAKPGEIIKFHVDQTIAALAHDPSIDLVVWSETMMPPLNKGARDYFGSLGYSMLEDVHRVLAQIAQNRNVAILAGGAFEDKLRPKGRGDVADDRRNSAYFYTPAGRKRFAIRQDSSSAVRGNASVPQHHSAALFAVCVHEPLRRRRISPFVPATRMR